MSSPFRYVALFDGCCKFCSRAVRVLHALDGHDRIELIDLNDAERVASLGQKLDRAALLRDFHAVRSDGRVFKGYEAYCELAKVLPVISFFTPILRWRPIAALGTRIYRYVADHRCTSATCRV